MALLELFDERYGPQYVYSDGNTQQTIPVSDVSITNKTYEKYEPKIIEITIPIPVREERKRKLFTFLDKETEDE